MLFILGIIALGMSVPITRIVTEHVQKMAEIKGELLREEIELEKLKQQNFVMETEKMKLELTKMRLDDSTERHDILNT